MRIGTWFLKITLVLVGLLAIFIGVIPLAATARLFFNSGDVTLEVLGSLAVFGTYIVILGFLVAVYFAERLLSVIDRGQAFSVAAVKLLRRIKVSVMVMTGGATLWLPFVYGFAQVSDAPGVMLIGLAFFAIPLVIMVFLAILERLWQAALDYKIETDLTI